MEADAYRTFAELEDRHFWFVSRRNIFFHLLRKLYEGQQKSLAVLEVGCGAGGMLPGLAEFGDVHGLDVAHDYVRYCKERGFHKVLTGSGYALPFPDASFDLVALYDTIEHIPDDHRAMAEVTRILRPGGRVMVSVPAHQWLFSQNDKIAHHFRRYTRSRLRKVFAGAGLAVEKLTYFNFLLFPIIVPVVLLQKLREKLGLLPADAHNVRMPSRPMNWLLTRIMSSERHLLPRVSLPTGHSLIGLATKREDGAPPR